jgi:hypothetical protein
MFRRRDVDGKTRADLRGEIAKPCAAHGGLFENLIFPSPLVGEGGVIEQSEMKPDEGFVSTEADPSPVASLREAPPSPTGGEGKKCAA